jgi:hypothetical protein
MEPEFWFDGDYSENYYGEGHWEPEEFIARVIENEESYGNEPVPEDFSVSRVEHLWARWTDEEPHERFELVKNDKDGWPITRYEPW